MTILPDINSDFRKKEQVKQMFDRISLRYDLINHLLSFNIDKHWRRRAVKILKSVQPLTILDVATGTADFAIEASAVNPQIITGIDLSDEMLEIGRRKISRRRLSHVINLEQGDSEALPFPENCFDAAIVGFGVRNFENLQQGLREILRVLNPGGTFIVLEFSRPQSILFRPVYNLYFTYVLPFIGRIVSGNNSAYMYLRDSVNEFPCGEDFIKILELTGFINCSYSPVTMGIATIYTSQKPKTGQ